MNNIITATFRAGETTATAYGLKQWDYGQILRIEGLSLPPAVEIHFSLQDRNGEAPRSLGETVDGVTTVPIPNSMLENPNAYGDSYYIYAWVYLIDETSGQTEYTIRIRVETRSKPADWVPPDEPDFGEQLKNLVVKEREAAQWYAQDASEFAKQAESNLSGIEKIKESVELSQMQMEELKEQSQTSAERAAISEQNARESENSAMEARTGAELALSDVEKIRDNIQTELAEKISRPRTAKVGQVLAVSAIDETGKPTEFEAKNIESEIDDLIVSKKKTWSSEKINEELKDCVKYVKITVNLIGSEGNIPVGNTIYVYEIVDTIETLSYSTLTLSGSAIVRVPRGSKYRITASTDAEGFYAPTEVTGAAIHDSEATIRYTELAYPKTIRDLQTLAQMGLAGDVVAIGDEFTTTYTYDGNEFEMPWIVTDIKEVEFEDGSTGQGVFLEVKYATIESIQFDAPHQEIATEETAIEGLYYVGRTDNTYTLLSLSAGDTIPYSDYTYIYHDTIRDTSLNIYRYGHNRALTSALRQWLNSDADKGQWWKAPKVGFCPPSQLNQIKGFMAGLPQEFLDCVAKVKRTYYTNSVTDGSVIDVLYDKFFAATGTELYGSVNDNEGTYWPYYKEVTGLSAPSNAANTGRIKYALNAKTSPQYCWSLSCYRSNSCNVWYRYSSGQLYGNLANGSYRAVPACVIGKSTQSPPPTDGGV